MAGIENYIWTEKYRPDTLDGVKGNEVIVDRMKEWIDDKSVPNILLAGPQGTGKTALATAFAKDKYGDDWKQHFKQLNASDDRGIDVVRKEIKSFAQLSTVSDYQYKIIFLDEADALCVPAGTEVVTGYPSKPEVKKIEDVSKDGEPIPSVDFDTNEVQSDKGKMLETGTAPFYDLKLSDGREVIASPEHPFFTVDKNGQLDETKLEELSSGDEIADFKDDIGVSQCEVCGTWTGNSRFCSKSCKNQVHSDYMSDPENNPTKGNTRSKEERETISEALTGGPMAGENNPNWNGDWHGPSMSEVDDEKYEEWCRNISEASPEELSREHKEAIGEGVMRAFHGEVPENYEYTPHYRRIVPDSDSVKCEICGDEKKTEGRDGIYVHHIDGDRDNNSQENLLLVCPRCHNFVCHDRWDDITKGWKENDNRSDPEWVSDGGVQSVETVEVESVEFSHEGKAYNITMEDAPNFMLANGLLTHNTRDAQPALRRVMEDYSDRTRFILSCNYPNKIIDPIQSRCTVFRVEPLEDDVLFDLLENIAQKEGVEYSPDQIEQIVKMSEGDARNAIHTLQSVVIDGQVSDETLDRLAVFPDREAVSEIFEKSVNGDVDEAMTDMEDLLRQGVDPASICDEFVYVVKTSDLPEDAKVKMIDKVADTEWRILNGAKPQIQFNSLLANLRVARHLSLEPFQRDQE